MKRVIILILTVFISFSVQKSYGEINMNDYCYVPPVLSASVKPNVLIVMDFSGSMQFPAYLPCNFGGYSSYVAQCGTNTASVSSTWRYDPSKTYYGYFDPEKCYQYSSSAFEENSSCNCSNKIGTSSCISGNLLNWITATRVDISRWVLTGGRTSSSGGNTFLESEGAEYTIKDENLNCEFEIQANTTSNRRLTIKDYNGTCPLGNNVIRNANIKIRPSDPNSIKGVIHSFCDTSDLRGQINEKCQLIMEFMVFSTGSGSYNRRGEIRVGKNATIAELINAINNETPYWGTPTGEALWEAYDYYKQSNAHNFEANSAYINRGNGNTDPYYDGSGGNSIPVSCRKGFVLLISDGAWNGEVDPVVPARVMATQDLRDDLPGIQNVYTYVVYAFGDDDPGTALQGRQASITTAIFGGFRDIDNNNFPYPFTNIQYPEGSDSCAGLGGTVRTNIQTTTNTYCNSRGVTYPLPQCNPSSTWDSGCEEWDTAFGSPKDGLPYNFFEANDALSLRSALLSAITDILRRASAGATVATLTSRASVSSVIVQPYFYPKYTTTDGKEISWIGFLRSFWVDTKQNLREDTTADKILNLVGVVFDKIFQFFFDASSNETKVAILQGSDVSSSCTRESVIDFNQVKPVFESSCQLALTRQQDRIILYNKNGNLHPFQTGETDIRDAFQAVDNTINQTKADCIIRYIRGENLSNDTTCGSLSYVRRVREFDTTTFSSICPGYSSLGDATWKLGDIYASTPSVAGSDPLNTYHLRYGDRTYLDYIRTAQYKNRPSLIFVGANDGMLHAFRIGYVKETGDPDTPVKLVNAPDNDLTDLIGKEEWAFIPRNALPYLVWQGHPEYCRVPTVDYRTYVFDASIGGPENSPKDVDSWKTVLVGTMGFGGKELGNYSSSVFALNITNLSHPQLLWEVSLPDKTLTTSHPAVVRLGDRNRNGEWYVVIGTGPKDPAGESFTNSPKLYFINLRTGDIVKTIDIPIPNNVSAAVGDITVVDVDSDYQDDVIYFGAYGKDNSGKYWGNFYRLSLRSGNNYKTVSSLRSNDICNVVDLGSFRTAGHSPPVFGAANFTKDENNKLWVFFGTGRYLSQNDKTIPYKNYFIGFKDDNWNGSSCVTYRKNDMGNVTNSTTDVVVSEIRQMCMCDSAGCGMRDVVYNTTTTIAHAEPVRGWYHELTNEGIYSQPLVLGGIVDTLTFVPPQDICEFGGSSNLIAVYYKTGRPYPRPSVLSPEAVSGTIAIGQTVSIKSKMQVSSGMPPLGNPFQALQSSTREGSEKFVQVGTGVILRFSQQSTIESRERFLLWIEK